MDVEYGVGILERDLGRPGSVTPTRQGQPTPGRLVLVGSLPGLKVLQAAAGPAPASVLDETAAPEQRASHGGGAQDQQQQQ